MNQFFSINPYTEAVNATFEYQGINAVNEQIEKSQLAFESWKNTSFEYRAEKFLKLSDLLSQNVNQYAELISKEMGKPISEAIGEVLKCKTVCEYYAQNAEKQLADEYFEIENQISYVKYQPLGIVLAVMPWNFPFWQVFRFAAPTLMAGNVGILKHASNVPMCAEAIEKIFLEADFPENVFKNVFVKGSHVSEIIRNPKIKAVTLTGSEKAGACVASVAGESIKKSVLELGGNDAFIVLEDADLEKCVAVAVKSRLQNAGQSCIASKRFIVQEGVYEQFKELLIKEISAHLVLGNPMDSNTTMGCLARKDLAHEVKNQVQKSIELGANIVFGKLQQEREDAIFSPIVLEKIPENAPAYREEIFGPVFSLFKFEYVQEAVQLANDSNYGLGGSVWTKDLKLGQEIASEIETGAVFVNTLVKSDTRLPFGGVKNSGFGREMSWHGIREFVNAKTVVVVN